MPGRRATILAARRGPLGPAFRRLWAAAAVSNLGDGVARSAIPLLAVQLTDRPALVAGLVFAQQVPWLIFGLFAGVVADRVDRRRLMGGVDLARGIVVGVLAVLVVTDRATIAVLWGVMFLLGTGETFFDSASQAFFPNVVREEHLERANGRLFVTQSVVDELAGPPVGAFLFAAIAPLPFFIDGASFVVAALIVLTFPRSVRSAPARATADAPRARIRDDLRTGAQFLFSHRVLRRLMLIGAIYNGLAWGSESVLALFAIRELGVSTRVFGLVLAELALGGIAAGLFIDRITDRLGPGRTMAFAFGVVGVGATAAGASPNAVGFAAGLTAVGFAGTAASVVLISLRQALVPDELRGRVNSMFRLGLMAAAPVGALVAGQLATHLSVRAPALALGVGSAVLAAFTAVTVTNRDIAAARNAA